MHPFSKSPAHLPACIPAFAGMATVLRRPHESTDMTSASTPSWPFPVKGKGLLVPVFMVKMTTGCSPVPPNSELSRITLLFHATACQPHSWTIAESSQVFLLSWCACYTTSFRSERRIKESGSVTCQCRGKTRGRELGVRWGLAGFKRAYARCKPPRIAM